MRHVHGYVQVNKRVGKSRPKFRGVLRQRCVIEAFFAYSTTAGVTCPDCLRLISCDVATVYRNLFHVIERRRLPEQASASVSPAFELRPIEPLTWHGRDVFLGAILFFTEVSLTGIRARLYRAFRDGKHLDFLYELESLRDVKLENYERSVPGLGKIVNSGHVWTAVWAGDNEGGE